MLGKIVQLYIYVVIQIYWLWTLFQNLVSLNLHLNMLRLTAKTGKCGDIQLTGRLENWTLKLFVHIGSSSMQWANVWRSLTNFFPFYQLYSKNSKCFSLRLNLHSSDIGTLGSFYLITYRGTLFKLNGFDWLFPCYLSNIFYEFANGYRGQQ